MNFDVMKGRGVPTTFSNKLKEFEKVTQIIKTTESSYLYFQFKLEWDKGKSVVPSFVGVILKHPVLQTATNIGFAKYNKDKDYWTASLDLGDPVNNFLEIIIY